MDPGSSLIDHLPDAVFVKDTDGRYQVINRAGALLFERPAAEVVGRTDEELLGKERSDQIRATDEQVLRSGQPVEYERRRLVGDREIFYLTTKTPLLAPGGEVVGVVGIGRDVTELKRLQSQLFLADRMLAVGTLAAGVAHEINNPLAYVSGNLEFASDRLTEILAARGGDPEMTEVVQALQDCTRGAARIADIVRDLRMFARPDADLKLPTDLVQVLDVAVRLADHTFRGARLVRGPSENLPKVRGGGARLGQVFVGLLVNAAQAMPAGRPALQNEIRVETRVEGERVLVEVRDNGVGMDEEVLRRVFDPFFTTREPGHGTGLGLWVTRNLVEGLGGQLTAESEPGVGSLFRVGLLIME